VKPDDLKAALAELSAEAGRLAEAAASADPRPPPVLLAEILLAADRAARKLCQLRVRLEKGGRRERD
jgi:hypothetical protein